MLRQGSCLDRLPAEVGIILNCRSREVLTSKTTSEGSIKVETFNRQYRWSTDVFVKRPGR